VDGWVSLEVSPLLAYDTKSTLAVAKELFGRAQRANLLIKIPGTKEGLPAIEEAIFAGIPVNVTLLFSREHYLAAVDAYIRGIERRVDAGLNPSTAAIARASSGSLPQRALISMPSRLVCRTRERMRSWRRGTG
jgi:transaldolase